METFSLLAGLILIGLVGLDFFYTTLSGSGAFRFTRFLLAVAQTLQMRLARWFGRDVFRFSGLLVNLILLTAWIVCLWLGLFLVFSSNPEAIVSTNGRPATAVERLYFTGYVISTLGLGDFKPLTADFKIAVGALSFFGFAFFSTSMTYLLSVSSAAVDKRTLSLAIEALGSDPAEVAGSLLRGDRGMAFQQIATLQKLVERHDVNHQIYPALYCYNSVERRNAVSLNVALLDEAVSILLHDRNGSLTQEVRPLRKALDSLLEHFRETYAEPRESETISAFHWHDLELDEKLELPDGLDDEDLRRRRRILTGMLHSDFLDWSDIYPQLDRVHTTG